MIQWFILAGAGSCPAHAVVSSVFCFEISLTSSGMGVPHSGQMLLTLPVGQLLAGSGMRPSRQSIDAVSIEDLFPAGDGTGTNTDHLGDFANPMSLLEKASRQLAASLKFLRRSFGSHGA